ncbi:hypothetical protein [Pseudooctadecabacter sp.]|uniref:hypothetical protein n=1 Tax=Pseudooctadecabacter sp. TaxID=1966338 RepID=UPI0025E99A9C|nr:hypothetical protein [Pseudooctadecabacter sp.]
MTRSINSGFLTGAAATLGLTVSTTVAFGAAAGFAATLDAVALAGLAVVFFAAAFFGVAVVFGVFVLRVVMVVLR